MNQTMTASSSSSATRDHDFVISRTFGVRRELMFEIWTKREHLERWFGPKGVEIVRSTNDLRPGGLMHYGMRTPDGNVMWGKWVYREIVAPERLVFVVSFSDESGGITRHPMSAGWPLETLSTITFDGVEDYTKVTVRWAAHNATELERETFDSSHDSMLEGWSGTLERLTGYLAEVQPRDSAIEHALIETPRILQTQPQLTAFIHLTISRDDIREVMGAGISEVRGVLAAQGIAPAGPWLNRHRKMDPEIFDFEITVPVTQPIVATGRVQPGELPAVRAARTIYRGGYEGLGDAWSEFMEWIAAEGHTPAPDLLECYLSGPEADPDPANWRTELTRPLLATRQ